MDDGAWFAAKKFGYGAGLPIAWQGWALILAFLGALIGLALLLMPGRPTPFVAIVVILSVLQLILVARKTRGGWRWRWGRD